MNEAEQIVRDLAEQDAPLDYEYGDCLLCAGKNDTLEEHEESCPWRRAKQWLSSHQN